MKKDLAMKAIGYAVLFNFIVVLVPITVGIIDIFQSSYPNLGTSLGVFVGSKYNKLASDMLCYTALSCRTVLSYVVFVIELIVFSGIIYFISLRKGYSIAERKKLLIWFVITFPFAHYLMYNYVVGVVFLITMILKFGLVSVANY